MRDIFFRGVREKPGSLFPPFPHDAPAPVPRLPLLAGAAKISRFPTKVPRVNAENRHSPNSSLRTFRKTGPPSAAASFAPAAAFSAPHIRISSPSPIPAPDASPASCRLSACFRPSFRPSRAIAPRSCLLLCPRRIPGLSPVLPVSALRRAPRFHKEEKDFGHKKTGCPQRFRNARQPVLKIGIFSESSD